MNRGIEARLQRLEDATGGQNCIIWAEKMSGGAIEAEITRRKEAGAIRAGDCVLLVSWRSPAPDKKVLETELTG
jgi:hypothetical protein